MSKRDVISTLLRKQIPDRMGLHESFWPYIEDAWSAQGLPRGTDLHKRFGLDLKCVHWYAPPEPRPDLVATIEENDEWKVSRDGWGSLLKTWKRRAGTPEHVGFTLNSTDSWYNNFREPFLASDWRATVDAAAIKSKLADTRDAGYFATYSFMFVFEWLRKVLGDVFMLESLMLEKDFINDFNDSFTNHFISFYEWIFKEAGLPDGIHLYEDLGYTRSAFASPRCHRELVLPYHRRMFGFFKDHGLPVIVHTCGDFRPHLPALVEAGTDCIQTLEAKTGMDVVALARDWKDRLCFMGNLDIRPFESGNRDLIRDEIVGKMRGMKALRAPYIVMSDHSIPPTVKLADYEYALELYRAECHY
jgi:uroporphyrinogen decarboxylase